MTPDPLTLDSVHLSDEDLQDDPHTTPPESPPEAAPPPEPAPGAVPEPGPEGMPETAPPPFQETPWSFRVDGTEVKPDGAMLTERGILIPAKAWDQVRGQYLGNRESWRQQQTAWQQRESQYQEQVGRERQAAQVANQFVQTLIQEAQQSPKQFVERLDGLIADLPLRVKQAELEIYRQRDEQRQQERQHHEVAQATERLENDLQAFFGSQVQELLKDPAFAPIARRPDEMQDMIRDLYDRHGLGIFESVPTSEAGYAAQRGLVALTQLGDKVIGWYPDRLREQVSVRADREKARHAAWTAAQKVEQRNTATLAAPKAVPAAKAPSSAAAPRQTNGQFAPGTKQSQRDLVRQSRKMLDDLTLDDLDD